MKKIALVLGVVLVSNMNNAFYGSQLIQKEYDQDPFQISFLEAADSMQDEYGYLEGDDYENIQIDDQIAIDEYDQHICDEVQPEKISATEALIKEILGYMFIQCITIKELTHSYCAEIKQTLDKWFTALMKA